MTYKFPEGGGAATATLATLPESLITEILQRLDLDSLCSTSCVSRSLHASALQLLSSLSDLNLSAFSFDERSADGILNKVQRARNIMIDCLQLMDSSVIKVLGPHVQELTLLKGSSLSPHVLALIGDRCPNLRVLVLELIWQESSANLIQELGNMSRGLIFLESFAAKIRGPEMVMSSLMQREFSLPGTLKGLKLQSVDAGDFIRFIWDSKNNISVRELSTNLSTPVLRHHPHFLLQHLSLVVDIITDELINVIVDALPKLIELHLEDRPYAKPMHPRDLSNYGLQALCSCQYLTAISIVRSTHHCLASFKMINDMGMFLMSEGCQGLQSVSLSGFSAVTDAGFSSFFRSCHNLKKFEIRDASLLSDLAFHDISAAEFLVELRVLSCSLITSEAFSQLNSFAVLEVLDTSGCKSIGDTCLSYISGLQTLTTLNLGGADVTDKGLIILGDADLPITRLRLRGCSGVTDRGITHLFVNGGKICKTLAYLDLTYTRITDRALTTIASACESLNELCIRSCLFVTDASLEILAGMRRSHGGNRPLQKLDLYNCVKLASGLMSLMQKHAFCGLKWVGAGLTSLENQRNDFAEICRQQPWLRVCFDGCEMGCHDGWQFH